MTAKYYLSGYKRIKMRLQTMTEQYEQLKSATLYLGVNYSEAPKPAYPNPRRGEEAILRMLEMESRMNSEFSKLAEISETIEKLANPLHQRVLVKHYISDETWNEIAAGISITTRHLRRIHAKALEELENILKSCP